jgi:hypothetical protein
MKKVGATFACLLLASCCSAVGQKESSCIRPEERQLGIELFQRPHFKDRFRFVATPTAVERNIEEVCRELTQAWTPEAERAFRERPFMGELVDESHARQLDPPHVLAAMVEYARTH